MRKLLTFGSVLLFLAVIPVPNAYSQIELFGGYSHLHLGGAPSNIGSSSNGWASGVYLHVLGPLGFEADYSDHYGVSPHVPPNGGTYYVPGFAQLYGPRFTLALPRIHPYFHALFGNVHGVARIPFPDVPCTPHGCPAFTSREDALGLDFGGGLNVKATSHIWLRLIQVDYLRAQFTRNGQNDTRISAGVVFRFGQW